MSGSGLGSLSFSSSLSVKDSTAQDDIPPFHMNEWIDGCP
jgi:hypothetical protein